MTKSEKLDLLIAKDEIREIIQLYALSLDRKDWDLHKSLFTSEIEMDYSASIGSGGPQRFSIEQWVEGAAPFFNRLEATQHITATREISIDGDKAYALSVLHAQHYLPNDKGGSIQRMIGSYENYLIKEGDRWKINKVVQHVDWNEGNFNIFTTAATGN